MYLGCQCRKDAATVEDIDYFMCQCEMMEQLQKEYYTVERVVSECHISFHSRVSICVRV